LYKIILSLDLELDLENMILILFN